MFFIRLMGDSSRTLRLQSKLSWQRRLVNAVYMGVARVRGGRLEDEEARAGRACRRSEKSAGAPPGARCRETSHEAAPCWITRAWLRTRRFRTVAAMRASAARFLPAFARFGPPTYVAQMDQKVHKARSDMVRRQGLEPRTRRLR